MKKFFVPCLVILIVLSVSFAEDKGKEDFWSKLKKKIESIRPKKKRVVVTAVGGVKGAQEDPIKELYWKGKEQDKDIATEELDKFKVALEHAINGHDKDSLKVFNELIIQYSNSPLKEDAIQAIENLKIAQ
ncbi:MAG: hypothetical protein SWO11_07590 [Thermodesulfobacteriota bacterium]|nr:hypothetical protein [Thermodesulfobacteriota bacterium]